MLVCLGYFYSDIMSDKKRKSVKSDEESSSSSSAVDDAEYSKQAPIVQASLLAFLKAKGRINRSAQHWISTDAEDIIDGLTGSSATVKYLFENPGLLDTSDDPDIQHQNNTHENKATLSRLENIATAYGILVNASHHFRTCTTAFDLYITRKVRRTNAIKDGDDDDASEEEDES